MIKYVISLVKTNCFLTGVFNPLARHSPKEVGVRQFGQWGRKGGEICWISQILPLLLTSTACHLLLLEGNTLISRTSSLRPPTTATQSTQESLWNWYWILIMRVWGQETWQGEWGTSSMEADGHLIRYCILEGRREPKRHSIPGGAWSCRIWVCWPEP